MNEKIAEVVTRISQAAGKFAKVTKKLNTEIRKTNELDQRILAENNRSNSLSSQNFAS